MMSSQRTASERSTSDPHARALRGKNLAIAAILLFQIATPLSYYLGERTYDERFSWRMFSTLRLRNCKVAVTEHVRVGSLDVPRRVNIERDVHVAWLRLLERMRSAVIDNYLERRCAAADVTSVQLVCHCSDTDGQPLPTLERKLTCGHSQREAEVSP